MKLEKHLVLNKYLLSHFGFSEFEDLRERLKILGEDYDPEGRSNFCNEIVILPDIKLEKGQLLRYDEAIKKYVETLRKYRRQTLFLKYFQYLALLFSEIFFDKYFNHKEQFKNEINLFLEGFNSTNGSDIEPFSDDDLKKMAFWMATGSGKTLIMHVNYWQFFKYCRDKIDNILLITPNEGLSKQHYIEMNKSGIPCKLYDGNVDNLKTREGEVLIINIHKLTEEKKGKGVSIDVSFFDGKNLVFIDEGHKGQKTEEQKWKRLREGIGKNGFIFEYSATLGQVIGKNKDLLEEYAKSIIFDYSYKYFYTDGYGKDFYVYNLKEDAYSEKYADLLLSADLLSFYEQYLLYEENRERIKESKIEKPLWVFVGSKVSGKGLDSDVINVIKFLRKLISNQAFLKKSVKKILDEKSGLIDKNGDDIFKDKFKYLRKKQWDAKDIYDKIFKGTGSLELFEIKSADGEIGLKTSTSDTYFGVINVGDISALKKLLNKLNIEVKEDSFTDSLFFDINEETSPVNVLIGSKKFVEGWDSWRVSSMSLLNMGKGEGPQIIQLFGRGVRLKGRDFSLKREENPDYVAKTLQTLFIFGLNADYINAFLETLKREELEYEEVAIPIRLHNKSKWEEKIYTVRTEEGFDFTEHLFRLKTDDGVLSNLKLDLRPRISLAHGLETGTAETDSEKPVSLDKKVLDLLNWNDILLNMMNYKIAKGYFNLIIDKDIFEDLIKSNKFKLFVTEDQISVESFSEKRKIEEIVMTVLRAYMDKFYRQAEKQKSMENLTVIPLDKTDENLNFGEIILKFPKSLAEDIKKLMKELNKFYENDVQVVPTIHFGNHLYSPLVAYKKGKEIIKSSPVKLNKGETDFILDLRKYLENDGQIVKDKEIFLLRNLSRKGVGFFKTAGFYPDFVMWIKENGTQKIAFIDPKGIRNLGNFGDEKIQFCVDYIKEIEKRVKQEIKKKKIKEDIELAAFLVSVSEFDSVKENFGTGNHTKEDFEKHNILFMEDKNYIETLLTKIIQ